MNRSRAIAVVQIVRLTIALAGAALALVVLENSALAGCGDYVFIRNADGQLVRASSLIPGHGGCTGPDCVKHGADAQQDAKAHTGPVENVPSKVPCHGPDCSGRSEVPASSTPLPAPVRSGQESTALLVKLSDGEVDDGDRFAAVPTANAHELHYPQSIFHPPR